MLHLHISLLLLAICSLATPVCANILLFNNGFSPDNPFTVEVFDHWADEVYKVTGGNVRIRVEDSSRLGNTSKAYRILKRGTANIGFICPMYYQDKFQLAGVFDLPMVTSLSSEKSSVAAWDVYNSFPAMQAEFAEFEVLWIFVTPPYSFHTVSTSITELESLRGLQVTAAGNVARRTAELLGAIPRHITMTGVSAALQNKNAAGCLLPVFPLIEEGIASHLNYHLDENIFANAFFIVAEKTAWETLPEEDRESILSISGRHMSKLSGKVADRMSGDSRQVMIHKGDIFTKLSAEEREKWYRRLTVIRDEWKESANHPDAGALLEKVVREMKD